MDIVEVFVNREFGDIRTMTIDGVVWFCGKDVASALGYTNTEQAIRKHVDTEDKQTVRNERFESPRGMMFINESGLYSLVIRSKLPTAKKFKRWITSEVLPQIRKNGSYVQSPQSYIEALECLLASEKAKQKALEEKKQLQIELDQNKEWYSIKRVAGIHGVNWKSFNWRILKAKSKEMGYEVVKIFDANYGEVNTYHVDVWEQCYPEYEL